MILYSFSARFLAFCECFWTLVLPSVFCVSVNLFQATYHFLASVVLQPYAGWGSFFLQIYWNMINTQPCMSSRWTTFSRNISLISLANPSMFWRWKPSVSKMFVSALLPWKPRGFFFFLITSELEDCSGISQYSCLLHHHQI